MVNQQELDESKYSVHDYVLTIDADCFQEGENIVHVNGSTSFTVTVHSVSETIKVNTKSSGCGGSIAATSVMLSALALVGLGLMLLNKKKEK